ncbi:MAG: hypothetical protein SFV54_07565 [Bryobacteraceae bacterium]|nr:hypothetical protein [Bryobacteraceae bacterium]
MRTETAIGEAEVLTRPDAELVRSHLKHVLASPEFSGSPRLSRFLTFVVETALAGEADHIKESLIAVEVYGRPADYNPQVDSTVRVEAGRLRARLREYYEANGAQRVAIEMPKGTYAPVFRLQAAPATHEPPPSAVRPMHAAVGAMLIAAAAFAVVWSSLDTRQAHRAGALAKAPSPFLNAGFWRAPEPGVEAREKYQRAMELLRVPILKDGPPQQVPSNVVEAVRLFREVTAAHPRFAKGWAALAEAAEWEYEVRGNQPPQRLNEARAAALHAVSLDPALVEGWTILSSILLFRDFDLEGAKAACLEILELEPRNTAARQRYISVLLAQGRTEQARAEVERGIELQPVAAALRVRRAAMLYTDDRCEEAIREARAAAALTNHVPIVSQTFWIQGLCAERQGHVADAERMFRAALLRQPHDPWSEPGLGHLLATAGRTAEAEAVLFELREQVNRGRMTHVSQAVVLAGLRRQDEALAALERGFRERDDSVLFMASDPRLRELRDHPRFQQVVARIRQSSS